MVNETISNVSVVSSNLSDVISTVSNTSSNLSSVSSNLNNTTTSIVDSIFNKVLSVVNELVDKGYTVDTIKYLAFLTELLKSVDEFKKSLEPKNEQPKV